MATHQMPHKPELSAVSRLIISHDAKTVTDALPLEIIHNLKHQHRWTDLQLHRYTSSASNISLISGLPPKHSYVHPDLQAHLIKHKIAESAIPVQREWVLPMSIGETCTLKQLCGVFDLLPEREVVKGVDGFEWKDAKRVLAGMLSQNGMGGDGTVVYYIVQEGEVKPRQNG